MSLSLERVRKEIGAKTGKPTHIDLSICSYKRPSIVATLEAVARQTGVDPRTLRVIVADNTRAGEMREKVALVAHRLGLCLTYVHAPADNISIARNACLGAATAEWMAFLDDDEIPTPNWLGALLAEAERAGWDVVVGPVRAIYPDDAPEWARGGDFHSAAPVFVRGQIRTAYTGNVLFRRAVVERLRLKFREELGRSGGEDEDFFYRLFDAGARIGYAADAVVCERVPLERASIRWLLRRNFRAGQSHGRRLSGEQRPSRNILVASGKAAFCGVGALAFAGDPIRRNRFLTRGALHVGVIARLAGIREIAAYR